MSEEYNFKESDDYFSETKPHYCVKCGAKSNYGSFVKHKISGMRYFFCQLCFDEESEKEKRNPPYDCPYYFSNWNCDEMCKETDDYCQYDEYQGCQEYNRIFGINNNIED